MYSLIKNQNNNNKFTKLSLTPSSSPTKKSVIQDALQNKEINYFNFNEEENLDDIMKQNLKEKRFFMTQNFSKVKFQAKQFDSKFTGKRARSEANILKDLLKEDQEEKKTLKKQDSYMFLDMMLQNNFIQGNFKDFIVGSAEDQPYLLKQKQTEFAIRNYSNELPVLPKPISLVDQLQKDKQKSFRSQNLQININGYGLSDMHAPFLVKTLKHKPVKSVEIGNNNFKDKGIEMILSELINYETQSLDLSFNTFTFRIMDSFQNVLSQEYSLKDLNLEGNKLGDAAIEKISKYALHLEILNVANNSITNQGAIYINRMLKGQTRLRELKLHWNRINGIGGKLIAEALYHNDYLKVLDISYNSMGIGDPECSVYWAKMLSKDSKCGLIHLDLSYNRFDEMSSKIISNELRNNNTIYGLHYKGNSGEIDCQGFLVNINSSEQNTSKQEQEIQSTFRRMKTSNEIKGKFGVMENCWICEGWQEKEFFWNPTFSGPVELPPVFIHFNFDGYKPHQMKYINFNGRKYFSLFQMVPPNTKILYFFTAAGNQLHAKDQQWTIQEATITIQFADKSKECFLNKLNILRSSVSNQLYDSDYVMSIDCIPRKQELEAFMPKQQQLNFQWDIQNSIFEDRVKNIPDENFFNQCFDFDWKWGVRLARVVKEVDQLEKLRIYLKPHYQKLIKLYKYYASYQPNGELWCWNQQIYQDFVVEAGIVDGRYFKIKDSLLCFIMSNNLAETKTHPQLFNEYQLMLNPENCLIRYQMMEIFTLISIEKYIKPGLCKTLVDAVETLFKHGLGSIIDNIPESQEWRDNKLYTEKVDSIIKLYYQLFQQLFNKYSKRRDPKDVMGLFDFKQFLSDYKFLDIDEKTINIIFNSSLPIQVDELNKQTHMQMDLMSFIEALARIADQYSFMPYKQEQDSFWTREKCLENPLHIKFESFILRLIKNSNNISFQNEFDYQDNSMFLEDFESIKHGKQILEKTRKMIQKKVVGTISTILMMKGKKDKEKNYSLTNQVPSSFSIGLGQQNSKDQIIHQQHSGSFFNIKLKHISQGQKQENSQRINTSENDKQEINCQDESKQDNQSNRNSEDASIFSSRKNIEEEQVKQQPPQKKRSLIYIQTKNLKKETSLGSSRQPPSPAYIGNEKVENNKSIKLSARDLSDIKSSRKSGSNINLDNKLQVKSIDFETPISKAVSLNSTEINESSQKKLVQEPKIKIHLNQRSKISSKSPSTAVSSFTSKSNATNRVHFFPKKSVYDINEIKKNVFTLTQSQLDLNTPNVLVTQNSYLHSPVKVMNQNKNSIKRKSLNKIM
ncbi:hypothetical protein ABPG73_005817 [Tetrahymena malaccensis]